jgi:hypothetical protein
MSEEQLTNSKKGCADPVAGWAVLTVRTRMNKAYKEVRILV